MTAPSPVVEGFSLKRAQILSGSETFEDALARTELEGWQIYGCNEASLEPDSDSWDNEGDDAVLSTWYWMNYAEVSVEAGYVSFPLVANLTGTEITEGGGTAEVQTVTITGSPTGGTFTLTYAGQTTTGIAYNATAAAVKTALAALSNLDADDIVTAGGPLPGAGVTVTFDVAAGDVALMTANGASLTGGTTPAVNVAATTPGTGGGEETTYSLPLWREDSFNVPPRPMLVTMPSRDDRGMTRELVIGLYKVQFAPISFSGPQYKEGLKVSYSGRALLSAYDEVGVALASGKKQVGTLVSRSAT